MLPLGARAVCVIGCGHWADGSRAFVCLFISIAVLVVNTTHSSSGELFLSGGSVLLIQIKS